MIDDPKFNRLFLRLLSYPLTGREIKYLIMRFYYNKTNDQIAKWDGKPITRQGINWVMQCAYKKVHYMKK